MSRVFGGGSHFWSMSSGRGGGEVAYGQSQKQPPATPGPLMLCSPISRARRPESATVQSLPTQTQANKQTCTWVWEINDLLLNICDFARCPHFAGVCNRFWNLMHLRHIQVFLRQSTVVAWYLQARGNHGGPASRRNPMSLRNPFIPSQPSNHIKSHTASQVQFHIGPGVPLCNFI